MTQQPYAPPPQYPGYPPAQQQPQYPGYPPVQQQFQQPMPPGYPQPYAQPQQPAQPLATGTLDDFYNQPSSGGGGSLKFEQIGTRYVGIVTRPIGSGDIQQQTNVQGVPQFFKDGRPKFVMKVPLQMQPSPAYPDGLAQWYVKGAARDELVRAMAEAGAPEGPPEAGAILDITFTGTRSAGAGFNPAKLFSVRYTRPQGAAPAQAPAAATGAPSPAPEVPQQYAPQAAQQPVPPQQQPYAPPPANYPPAQQAQQFQQPAPPAQQQQFEQQPQAQQFQQPAVQPGVDLSQDQQALLAKLTGGGQ